MSRAIAFVLVVAPAIALADVPDTLPYRVKANDTFGIIASEFYGDRSKASFILAENKIVHVKPLQKGQLLRVPAVRELVTNPGDTFQAIALATLGSADRGGFLAEFNAMSPDDNLAAGTTVMIPFTVTHTAQGVEGLDAIAANYYGDRKFGDVLKRYNALEKSSLDKNEQIIVPAFNVKMHPARVLPPADPESATRRDRQKSMSHAAANVVPAARHAWRTGDFATVKKLLAPIDTSFVEVALAIDVGILLGSAHVALGETDDALVAFKRVLDRKPSHTLRKVDHSPKVLAIWAKASGE
jgi:hypothetical protein